MAAPGTVRADVGDCPDLELVLPARKEAVENAFLNEMREAGRLAIYRAMAAAPEPRPAFEDWKRARAAGIDIAPPPAQLRPWRPSFADVDDWCEPPKLAVPDHGALVIECDPNRPRRRPSGVPLIGPAWRRACSRPTIGFPVTTGTTASTG